MLSYQTSESAYLKPLDLYGLISIWFLICGGSWKRLAVNDFFHFLSALDAITTIQKQGVSYFSLFKFYANETSFNGNSASSALNKWLKGYTVQGVVHTLRHSLRIRLREPDVNSEMIDGIGASASGLIDIGVVTGDLAKVNKWEKSRICTTFPY